MPSPDGRFERHDLTAYARIRNAALNLFAAQGVAATSMREIAARGRVSLGLVQYHFRTKDVLRDEANKYAHAVVRDVFGYLEPADDAESRRRLAARLRHFTQDEATVLRHVARGVADRDPGALTIFDAYVDIAARHVSPRTAMHLVVRILGDALLRPALEEDRQNKPTASGN